MPEIEGFSSIQTGPTSSLESLEGPWKNNSQFGSVVDVLSHRLNVIRQSGSIKDVLSVIDPEYVFPNDDKEPRKPPIEAELRLLFGLNVVGVKRTSLVSVDELRKSAAKVWELKEADLEKFTQALDPLVELYMRREREEQAKTMLLLWDKERFRVITEMLLRKSKGSILSGYSTRNSVSDYNETGKKTIEEVPNKLNEVLKIADPRQKDVALQDLVESVTKIVGSITFLTPQELRAIVQEESYSGCLFLDTLADVVPILKQTEGYAEENMQDLSERNNGLPLTEADNEYMNRRNEAINSLLFGAKNNVAVRSKLGILLGRKYRKLSNR
ncbi:hypothetical protein HGA88_02210 [Candidatus Roizmanbacteria bacterium]|nr:hypothetical protein [Candidatus Roizmanbacteria bacterium]